MKMVVFVLAALISFSAAAHCDRDASVRSIRAESPCEERSFVVEAYLNSSRHGAWLSDIAGSGKNSLALVFAQESAGLDRVKAYVYRPQSYLHETFKAVFGGRIRCRGGKLPPELELVSVSDIRVSKMVENR